MTVTHFGKGINLLSRRAPTPHPKGLTLWQRLCSNARRACGRCSSLHITADRQPQRWQSGGTSPHSIWTCSGAYGSGPRKGAPICSLSWAHLAHSQPPHTFGWFINQPLLTIPAHWLIREWLMYTFACGLERTPGTGGEEGKILNWSVGEEEGRGGHSSLPRSQSIFRSPGFVRMRFPGNRSYRLLRNPTVAWDIARTLPMKTQKDDCCIPSCPPLHDPPGLFGA